MSVKKKRVTTSVKKDPIHIEFAMHLFHHNLVVKGFKEFEHETKFTPRRLMGDATYTFFLFKDEYGEKINIKIAYVDMAIKKEDGMFILFHPEYGKFKMKECDFKFGEEE